MQVDFIPNRSVLVLFLWDRLHNSRPGELTTSDQLIKHLQRFDGKIKGGASQNQIVVPRYPVAQIYANG